MTDNGKPQAPGCEIRWAAISGRWKFEHSSAAYLEGSNSGVFQGQPLAIGLALTNQRLQDGSAQVKVSFSDLGKGEPQGAGLVLGYQSPNERYLVTQLAAGNGAYSVDEFLPGFGWRPIGLSGSKSNLEPDKEYLLDVAVRGQRLTMTVDGVRIFEQVLRHPLHGEQVGLIASGNAAIEFRELRVRSDRPSIFVAMQFGEPFDTIYREVIQPGARNLGLEVVRIDEVAGPGLIFEDIKRKIADAKIVVAEITEPNQNVFYELGYAHALNKPTILLARRGRDLPFDIRSYRVIFYDDTIGGKPAVERNLENYLRSAMQDM